MMLVGGEGACWVVLVICDACGWRGCMLNGGGGGGG